MYLLACIRSIYGTRGLMQVIPSRDDCRESVLESNSEWELVGVSNERHRRSVYRHVGENPRPTITKH